MLRQGVIEPNMPPTMLNSRSSFLSAALALAAFVTAFLTGCDTVDITPTDAVGLDVTAPAPTAGKLRHAHLLDRAVRLDPTVSARGGEADSLVGFIVGLDTYRILSRYGNVDPYRILSRYQEMDPYRILSRYEYEDVFHGFAIWVDEAGADSLLADMAADDEIAWIEPDITISTSLGDVAFTEGSAEMTPWGLTRIGAGGLTGAGVDLFVIDTGVNTADVAAGTGYDFVLDGPAQQQDLDGHGTHIAGTAAALANGQGSVGIAPGATVHDLRVLTGQEVDDGRPVDLSRAIAAVEHVTAYKLQHPNRPVVVNFSLGAEVGTTAYNALDEAIAASTAAGVTFVIAAGNDGIDAATVTPAHVTEAVTVGAYGPDDRFAAFSNYGALLDILAPGVDIPSTASASSALAVMSGTSMAAAHVSGAAAAFLAANPTATPAQVAQAITATAQDGITGAPASTVAASVYAGSEGLMAANVPPFFQYALTAGDDIKSGLLAGLQVRNAGSGVPNANVFANDRIALPLLNTEVEGFGYYGGSVSGRSIFAPLFNPTGLPGAIQQAPIAVPAFRAQDFRPLATHESGTLYLQGPIQLGTPENPVIWYVDGNVVVSGETHISGYGILLVTGSVTVNGRITTALDGSTRLGLYANGNVTVNAPGTSAAAQIFSAADVVFRAPIALYGSVTAGDDVDVQSLGVEVHYRTASPALTEPFWPVESH